MHNEVGNEDIDLCSTILYGEAYYHQFLSAACVKSWIYNSNFNLLFVGLDLVFSHWIREIDNCGSVERPAITSSLLHV